MAARRRLDVEMVARGLAATRAAAHDLVTGRRVHVNGAVADKPARLVAPADNVTLAGPPARFVSRGGDKLDAALDRFAVSVAGARFLDCGASTGGFTDCLLQRGARQVVALDVGHGQLHPRVRHDPRVLVLERVNIRRTTVEAIGGLVDGAVADVSFISLTTVIPTLVSLCQPGAPMVLLVKPQFEAGRTEVSRGRGIVTDPVTHQRVRSEIDRTLVGAGCCVDGWMESPVRGGFGNVEFLVHATTAGTPR
jgi:23S rRNA (cytidine1920-2'-O)/16S rRNA (cytidine1409-2'-O)-methyltransferase